METKLPRSITYAVWALVGVVVASGVIAVLTLVQNDAIILAWSEGNPSAQEILATGGLDALKENPIVPKFGQLAVVSMVWFVMLVWVLAACLVGGNSWPRVWLTATVLVGVLVAVVSLRNHLPTSFVVASSIVLLLDLVLLWFLWHPDTTSYLRSFHRRTFSWQETRERWAENARRARGFFRKLSRGSAA
jgi:hypothetical protein